MKDFDWPAGCGGEDCDESGCEVHTGGYIEVRVKEDASPNPETLAFSFTVHITVEHIRGKNAVDVEHLKDKLLEGIYDSDPVHIEAGDGWYFVTDFDATEMEK